MKTAAAIVAAFLLVAVSVFAESGGWTSSDKTDPFTDEQTVYFGLPASAGEGTVDSDVVLFVRFSGHTAEMFVAWGSSFSSDESVEVLSRVDKDLAVTESWDISTSHEATFYGGDVKAMITRLLTASKFTLRVKPSNGEALTAIFNVAGFSKEFAKYPQLRRILRETALSGWKSWEDGGSHFIASNVVDREGNNRFPVVMITSNGKILNIGLTLDEFLSDGARATAASTLDNDPAGRCWTLSGGMMTYGGDASVFLRKILAAQSFAILVTPEGSEPRTVTIDPEGLADEIAKYPEIQDLVGVATAAESGGN